MKREQVEALIALSETYPTEWHAEGNSVYGNWPGELICVLSNPNEKENASFIAQSRNIMPQLVEEWKQQKDEIAQKDAENRRMREALELYAHDNNWHEINSGDDYMWNRFGHPAELARQALADIDAEEEKS